MNERFTEEQIKAYAAQFREGDAIWSGGKWNEVAKVKLWKGDTRIGANVIGNNRIINFGKEWHKPYKGVESGFTIWDSDSNRCDNPYRVTTLGDYELQGGEKLVWLGKSDHVRTFGKVYTVNENLKYLDDFGSAILPTNVLNWGIIPRYEMHIQVENKPKRNVSDEEFDKLLNEIDKTLEPIKNANQLSHVVQYPTAADREEEILKIKTFDLLNHDMSEEEIITDLKEIAHIEINNGNYDIVNKVVELVKEWEEKK